MFMLVCSFVRVIMCMFMNNWSIFTMYVKVFVMLLLFKYFINSPGTPDGIFSKPGQRIAVGKFLCAHSVGIFHGVQHSDAV